MTPLAQKMAALEAGNRIRSRRAEVRREIGSLPMQASRRRAAAVLADPEPACEGMTVYHLLMACYRLGHGTATRTLIRTGIPQHKRLSELTDRQRQVLVACLVGADISIYADLLVTSDV